MNNVEFIEEITKLTDEWYHLIGKDAHKDRDCHWYIETKWSYGLAPVYTVQHHGYILHDFEDQTFASYKDALEFLKKTLTKEIEEYNSYIRDY